MSKNQVCPDTEWFHMRLAEYADIFEQGQRAAWHAARKFKCSDNNSGMVLFEYETFEEWKNEKKETQE